ncbi:DUF4190 domain-containing protein [Streptomyces sp. NPDC052496]|uniref:DUF4190 domain-containing protein n=1 Tax=Streptomyces sp. NPDC052496 TaxID=3154951 RepID=UPI00341CA406
MPPIPGGGAAPYGSPAPGGWGGAPYPGGRPGEQLPPGYQPYWMPAAPNNGFGTAALVLGIIGATLSFTIVFGFLFGALAIVFGAVGRMKASRKEADNGGSALAGIILGGVGILLSVLMVGFVVVANATYEEDDGPWDPGYSDDSGSGGSTSGGSTSGGSRSDDEPDTYEAAPAPGPGIYEAAPVSAADPTAAPSFSPSARGRLVTLT